MADDGARVDFRSFADGRIARQIDMRADLAVVANGDMFVNDGVGRDAYVVSDFCARRDDGSWINAHVL